MNRGFGIIGAAAATALAAAPAGAEDGGGSGSFQGNGYRLSEGVILHSTAGAEGGFLSNVFYDEEDIVNSGLLRVGGDVRVASRDGDRLDGSRQRVSFDAGLGLHYQEYLSPNANARAQRDLDIDAFGSVVAFPDGDLSLVADNTLTRQTRPTNFESALKLNRLVNRFSAGPDWNPSGRSFTLGLRYENTLDFFEDSDAPYPDRVHHSGHLQGTWQLFPYTALFFDTSLGYYDVLGDSTFGESAATAFDAQVGASTAFTQRTSAEGYLGLRRLNYDVGEDFLGVTGGLSAAHRYSPTGRASAGYERRVQDSINANFYRDHRLHAGFEHGIDRIVAGATGDIRFREYVGVPEIAGGDEDRRDDLILASNFDLRYNFRNSMQASLRYRVARVQSDFQPALPDDTDPSYVRHLLLAGFRAAL